ncbi:MAG: zf-TFIIB domain-containing protein [Deltaproteobacteria bacterium]|nr:zf-TFIIB domain-containing protein [Deltaproteobacteria bacterium]
MVYREQQRMCPFCKAPMSASVLSVGDERVNIDLCDGCGGAYFDFYDGTPGHLARILGDRSERADSASPHNHEAIGLCPVCELVLSPHPDLEGVYRCGQCFGVFATPDGLRVLAETFIASPPPEKSLLKEFSDWLVDHLWARK